MVGTADRDRRNAHDRALRLIGATAPERATAGGAYFAEGFTFDGRGNRLTHDINGSGQFETLAYQGGLAPDRLTQVAGNGSGTLIQRTYGYDADGRVTSITWPADSSGQPSQEYTLGYLQAGGVTDSAVKQVAVGQGGASLTYDYVYDADNRRRAKVYPTGGRDEYFWTAGWQMLEDRGLRSSGYSVDEYLWLGGQPIGVRRSAFSSAWARQPQSTVDCTRVGEYVTQGCGWRHLVSNVTGRVVLAVDDAQAIAGVYEYQLSGHSNRQNWWGETPHPYGASTTYTVATVDQPVRGLSEAMRLRFGMVDLEPGSDVLSVENAASTQLWSASAWHSSTLSTPWLTTTTNGPLTATVVTNSCNAPPDGGACSAYAYQGVTLESVDYLRWQSTSTPWELSLRQPGQYYDAETGLFENWNRFYDADTGRYLSPEPLLQSPSYVRTMAQNGYSTPSYAYALNNPVRYTDPDGLQVPVPIPVPVPVPIPIPIPAPPSPWTFILPALLPGTAHAPGCPPGGCGRPAPAQPNYPAPTWPKSPSIPDFCAMGAGTMSYAKTITCTLRGDPNQLPLPGFASCIYDCPNGEVVAVESSGLPCDRTIVVHR